MSILNFECKARAHDILLLERMIQNRNHHFIGEDHQTDTYFNVSKGRLKLREGTIENALIYYERENTGNARQSKVLLYVHNPDKNLKEILITVHGIKVIVDKIRKIYFIDNVKFHFDTVKGLGNFIEIEAIDKDGTIGIDILKQQCHYYTELFNIQPEDYIAYSYSDILLQYVSSS